MRVFEFQANECSNSPGPMVIDLDHIESIRDAQWDQDNRWRVHFVSGVWFFVTKAAYDRVLQAWKSQ